MPKIEVGPAERKEIRERTLPAVLRGAGEHYFRHYVGLLSDLYAMTQRPDVYVDLAALQNINWKEAVKKILAQERSEAHLEALALLDLDVGQWEAGARELEFLRARQEEKIPELEEEWDDVMRSIEASKQYYLEYYSWLVEEVPELRQPATWNDFRKWIETTLKRYEELMRNAKSRGETETISRIKASYLALEAALTGRVMSPNERPLLLQTLDLEMALKRAQAGSIIEKRVLGRPYNREELLAIEKDLIRFRQFRTNLESGEWVRLSRRI